VARFDTVAASLLQRYPLPTSSGTANNYRRTENETDNQDQWVARVDHKFATNRDQMFARIAYFRDDFIPVTFLPDGSGTTPAGVIGPQTTDAWAFASNWQRTLTSSLFNELRAGDTRRHVTRTAASLSSSAGSALNIPGIPSGAQFPETLPTFLVAGLQQLGSPPNTASDFRSDVTEVADTATWVKGR